MNDRGSDFPDLIRIMDRLRSPTGCPWDRKQTIEKLKIYIIDEAYEVLESIDSSDRDQLSEELGDLLFQIIFVARLAQEEGAFDIDEVINKIRAKMIRRHPHVFANARVSDPEQVLNQWEKIKIEEGKRPKTSAVAGVPQVLPALYRAYRLGLKAGRVGFDWPDPEALMSKVHEELRELHEALSADDYRAAGDEIGDLLFALANLARHIDREPEGLLRKANARFEHRFGMMEEMAADRNTPLTEMSIEEMDRLWETVKRELKRKE
jgi:MazG family protein